MLKFEQPKLLVGFFFAFLGTALFALKSIFIKLAYEQGLNTDSVLMLRMAIALPIYLAIMVYLVKKPDVPSKAITADFLLIIFLGFIGYFLASWLDLKGLEFITASLERLTLFTYPIFVSILGALFFKTPLSRKIITSLVLTYLGLWVVFSQELHTNGDDVTTGVLLVMASALSDSFYVLLGKRVIHSLGSVWFTALAMSVSSVFVLLYYLIFFNFDTLLVTTSAWFWVVLLAVFSTVLPSFLISEAIAKIGPAQTGVVGTLGPMMTIGLAIFILDEPFSIYHALGIVLVMTGVILLTIKKKNAT
jgi:drug/metabolite transporter (DMT)-like permease